VLLQYLEARNKGRLVSMPSRDSRQGLDVAYLSALTTSAKLAEEEQRIRNHFLSQTMSLKVTAPCKTVARCAVSLTQHDQQRVYLLKFGWRFDNMLSCGESMLCDWPCPSRCAPRQHSSSWRHTVHCMT